jgi:hypothetical protein
LLLGHSIIDCHDEGRSLRLDEDGDGVADMIDLCPLTPQGVQVNLYGCPLDTDKDGVPDYLDQEPNSAANAIVNIDGITSRPSNGVWHDWSIRPGSTDNMTPNTGTGPSVSNDYGSCWNSYSPSGITSYTEGHITAGVDKWNIDLRCFTILNSGMGHSYQIRLGKVSDDSPFTKENTHQLTLGIRMYPTRYVP